MKLNELIQASDGILKWQNGIDWQAEVLGITSDSRKIGPGMVFVAIKGEKTDGHQYLAQALNNGAVSVILEDETFCGPDIPWILVDNSRKVQSKMLQAIHGYPSRQLKVIGVTGTNGKTTVTNMIATILEAHDQKLGLIGTIANRIGETVIPSHLTTPDSGELTELLSRMVKEKANYAIMEVSSHALAQERVAGVEFDLAVFTNLTQDHLDFHGNMEEYLQQKSRLFSELDAQGSKGRQKAAILNKDDKSSAYLADHCKVPVITYGLQPDCLVRAAHINMSAEGFTYQLTYVNQVFTIQMKLPGMFNVYNSLAAVAVALVLGVPIDVIQSALSKMPAVPGRFQRVEVQAPYSVFIDYSHTPDSLKNCINTANEFRQGKVITVFGAGGHRDRGKRPLMGEIAARLSDYCIVTSDNPREESPQAIINDILAGMTGPYVKAEIKTEVDRRQAIQQAIALAQAGDVVLICGKGHENYQIIGTETLHFDDYEEAVAIIKKDLQQM